MVLPKGPDAAKTVQAGKVVKYFEGPKTVVFATLITIGTRRKIFSFGFSKKQVAGRFTPKLIEIKMGAFHGVSGACHRNVEYTLDLIDSEEYSAQRYLRAIKKIIKVIREGCSPEEPPNFALQKLTHQFQQVLNGETSEEALVREIKQGFHRRNESESISDALSKITVPVKPPAKKGVGTRKGEAVNSPENLTHRITVLENRLAESFAAVERVSEARDAQEKIAVEHYRAREVAENRAVVLEAALTAEKQINKHKEDYLKKRLAKAQQEAQRYQNEYRLANRPAPIMKSRPKKLSRWRTLWLNKAVDTRSIPEESA